MIRFDSLDGDFFNHGSSTNIHRTVFMYYGDVVGDFCDWVSNFLLPTTLVCRFHHDYLVRNSVLMCYTGPIYACVGFLGDI